MRTSVEVTKVCTHGGAQCRAVHQVQDGVGRNEGPMIAMICKEAPQLWCIDTYAPSPISVARNERCRKSMNDLISSYRKAVENL